MIYRFFELLIDLWSFYFSPCLVLLSLLCSRSSSYPFCSLHPFFSFHTSFIPISFQYLRMRFNSCALISLLIVHVIFLCGDESWKPPYICAYVCALCMADYRCTCTASLSQLSDQIHVLQFCWCALTRLELDELNETSPLLVSFSRGAVVSLFHSALRLSLCCQPPFPFAFSMLPAATTFPSLWQC